MESDPRAQRLVDMVDRYQAQLLRLCYLVLRDTMLAEDAVEDMRVKEVAAVLGVTPSTVTNRLQRAAKALRIAFKRGNYRVFTKAACPLASCSISAPRTEASRRPSCSRSWTALSAGANFPIRTTPSPIPA